jgi:hypothetical protein
MLGGLQMLNSVGCITIIADQKGSHVALDDPQCVGPSTLLNIICRGDNESMNLLPVSVPPRE